MQCIACLSSCCNVYQSSSWVSLRPNLKINVLHGRGKRRPFTQVHSMGIQCMHATLLTSSPGSKCTLLRVYACEWICQLRYTCLHNRMVFENRAKVYHLCVSQQVLSKITTEALSFYAIPGSAATQTFLTFVDRLFDMLNVRHPDEFAHKRKEEFKLYITPDDDRLKVHMYTFVSTNTYIYEQCFIKPLITKNACNCHLYCCILHVFQHTVARRWLLGYLDRWDSSVRERQGFAPAKKELMLMSRVTREGLRVTGMSIQ